MIYLFGGPPRCGKTTLAEAIARKKSLPYFSIDHVTSAITPYIPEKDYVEKLPLRIALQETHFSNDIFYSKYSSEQIVDIYLRQAQTLWPGVKGFIEYAVHDGHDLILEGWQLLPHLINTIVTPANSEILKIIFMIKLDVGSIESGLTANPAQMDWVTRNTKESTTFSAIAGMIGLFGSYIKKDADDCSFASSNTESNFRQTINSLVDSL